MKVWAKSHKRMLRPSPFGVAVSNPAKLQNPRLHPSKAKTKAREGPPLPEDPRKTSDVFRVTSGDIMPTSVTRKGKIKPNNNLQRLSKSTKWYKKKKSRRKTTTGVISKATLWEPRGQVCLGVENYVKLSVGRLLTDRIADCRNPDPNPLCRIGFG